MANKNQRSYDEFLQCCLAKLQGGTSRIRQEGATLLGELLDPAAVQPLIELLANDESADVRWSAAIALGNIGSEDATESLIESLSDEDNLVRGRVIEALGKIGSEQANQALRGMLSHPSPDTRGRAAMALGKIGGGDVLPDLVRLFDDNSRAPWGKVSAAARQAAMEIETRLRAARGPGLRSHH